MTGRLVLLGTKGGPAVRTGGAMPSHTKAADAGCMARAAEVRHLVLNHLVPADDPEVTEDHWRAAVSTEWAGPVTVGRDGLEIAL